MRLFQSEMLQASERPAASSYRGPIYGARYDRRTRRAPVPAITSETALSSPPELAPAPRDILFALADFDRAA